MHFARHDDYSPPLFFFERRRNGRDFVGCVDYGRLKHADRVSRHPFVHQHLCIVNIFAEVRDTHCTECGARLGGLSQPHFWRITLAIQPRRFHGSQGHAPAKDDYGVSLSEGIFQYQPAAYAKKKYHGAQQQDPGKERYLARSAQLPRGGF